MKRAILGGLLLLLFVPLVSAANSDGISVRPFLIDATLVPREAHSDTIRLQSSYDLRTANIFATVNEISVGPDGEVKEFISPVMTDRTNTITSWIEIRRGSIKVPAGEQVDVPIKIQVHPFAEPGEYHAFIGLVETSKRARAEEIALAGEADGVVVKITVQDERVTSMRINALETDRVVTDIENPEILLTVENAGEIETAPVGELIFYDTRGIEVVSVPVNETGTRLRPGDTTVFTVPLPEGIDFGRYKANVNLRYGENQQASLFDSTSFFYVPLWYLVGISVFLLVLLIVLVLLYRRAADTAQMSEHGDEVAMFVRDGHNQEAKDHDIDLKNVS